MRKSVMKTTVTQRDIITWQLFPDEFGD